MLRIPDALTSRPTPATRLRCASLRALAALVCVLGACAPLGAADAAGPTPYPDAQDEKAWPGVGPIRLFGWMVDNRKYFWTQRQAGHGAVVFIGDSLTGNWDGKQMAALFPGLKIANRGIGGDVSRGVLFRLQEDALDLEPKALVVLIGSNDLSAHADPAGVIANIAAIIAKARQHDAAMPIVLCTIAPRHSATAPTKPGAHADLNARITAFAADQQHLALLDLIPVLGTGYDAPTPENYAADQLHLAPAGYERWAAALHPLFKKLGVE